MAVIILQLTQDQINEITEYINVYRRRHYSNDIVYDKIISIESQNWSNYLSKSNSFKHSNNKMYGENLSSFTGYKNDIIALIKKSIDMWYNEVKLYNFKQPESRSNFQAYHFTQLIWKSTISFGFGYTYNTTKKSAKIVMNFSPPGNYIGLFRQNVFPI